METDMALKIVIVGGVAGGMSAATRARRMNESAEIVVFEKSGFISFANCGLPYHIAGRIADESKLLVTTVAKVAERYRIHARVLHEVTAIDRGRKVVTVRDLTAGKTFEQPYDKLILAPGASAIVPPMANIDSSNVFLMRCMEDTRAIQSWLAEAKPKRVAIVGAGFIGLEMAEAMRDRGLEVTLIEKAPHPLPPLDAELSGWLSAELRKHGVALLAGIGLSSLDATGGKVTAVGTDDGTAVATDGVILSIGVRPNVGLARDAGLKIGASGAIAVDEYHRTRDLDIYAVGDAAEVVHQVTGLPGRVPLAGPANRDGRQAGQHAATGSSDAAGKVLGTAIVQVFDLTIGMTGLGEFQAKVAGLDVDSAYVLAGNHAGYYPGATQIRLKLVYRKSDGKVIGAQAVGADGVDKRIDVIATAMAFGATVDHLAKLDLAYAPQFGSAKDPVHLAAFVAQNQRRGLMDAVAPDDLDGEQLLDVRTDVEFKAGALPGAQHIPVDELRDRLDELDPAKSLVIYCGVGLRGFVAQRILTQHGFAHVRNLKGGYTLAMAGKA